METYLANGPDIETSGIDLRVDNTFGPQILGGEFSLGGEISYILKYEVADFEIEGAPIAGGDRVGQFNRSNGQPLADCVRRLPDWHRGWLSTAAGSARSSTG